MTTINQIVKAVETIDKSTTGLANAQCKLGQLLSSYKSERCESIKPKEFYGEIETAVGYKKAMVCQLIQLHNNVEKYGVILTLSASRYIQSNAKNEQFVEHVETVCEPKQGELVDKAELEKGFEKPESDKSTEEKMSQVFKTAVAIALKGKNKGDYDYKTFVEQANNELIKAVKEAFENEVE